MAILNYTTKIKAVKTITEIQSALATYGAIRTMTDYEDGQPIALSFQIETSFGLQSIRLPNKIFLDKCLRCKCTELNIFHQ